MFKAERIILGEAIFDHVEILPHDKIEEYGFRKIFEEYTIMFSYNNRWHTTHEYSLTLIHLRRNKVGIHKGMPFDKIVIGDDKSYEDGKIILPEDFEAYDIPIIWRDGFKKQLVFTAFDGVYIASDFNVQVVIHKPEGKYLRHGHGVKSARGAQ